MKKLGLLLITSVFLCSLIVLAGCNKALSKPEGLQINGEVLTWNKVENAVGYKIEINGEEYEAVLRIASYSFENLPAGTYVFRIKAVSDKNFKDSAWSASESYEKIESIFRLKLINNNTEYEISGMGKAAGDVVIPNEFDGKPITSIGNNAFYSSNTRDLLTSIKLGDNITKIGKGAFLDCKKLTAVTFNDKLTVIENTAFAYCITLKSIDIPDSVTTIGEDAFTRCDELDSVNLGNGLSSLSNGIFTECKKLESIEIPANVKSIGNRAFYKCPVLKTVTLEEGVTAIQDEAFWLCERLEKVTIPETVTSIGKYAFHTCTALKSENLTIGNNITAIGAYAFKDSGIWIEAKKTYDLVYVGNYLVGYTAEELEEAVENETAQAKAEREARNAEREARNKEPKTIRTGVLGIADSAFSHCQTVSITLTNQIKFIGTYSFYDCPNLTTIDIPNSVEIIDSYAFQDCLLLATVTIGNGLKTMGAFVFYNTALSSNSATSIVYAGNWIAGIKTGAIKENIKSIEVNSGVKGIATLALSSLINLGIVVFKDSGVNLISIGDYAFDNSKLLSYFNVPYRIVDGSIVPINQDNQIIAIPNSVVYIGNYAFHSVTNIIDVEFGSGLKTIGAGAFRNCWRYKEVRIPDNVETIGNDAFYGCTNVESVTIGSGVKSMGLRVFNDCIALAEVTFAEGITDIGKYTFGGCSRLVRVSLPSTLTSIDEGAFYKCDVLKNLEIPDSVTYLGSYAFYGCVLLNNVIIPDAITTINDYAFYNCNNITSIDIPDGVTTIGNYAFYKCNNAATLAIPDSVTKIGNYAFYGCSSLIDILIPESVTEIGDHSFRNCIGLTSLLIRNSLTKIGSHAFYGCNAMTIYSEASKRMDSWKSDWNSSYRPVIWGCALSEDRTFVESFKKVSGGISNPNAPGGIKPPSCSGYTFNGWTFIKGDDIAYYSSANVNTAPNNTTLYAIWKKNV